MSGAGFHVHGPHDHAVEHETQGHGHNVGGSEKGKADAKFIQWVAIFTAILATIGAIVSYKGGHTQNAALLYKNEAVLKKTDAANQWSFYQAKSTKQNLAELAESLATNPELKAEADKKSEHELLPHDQLAQAMTFIQIAISLAAICVLTRRRWMLGLAGAAAAAGIVYTVLAFIVMSAH